MDDKFYEKSRRKKVKGIKYFKNKSRENLTVVFSDATKKPANIVGKHAIKFDLSSNESGSMCSVPLKKKVNYKKYEIDMSKVKHIPTVEYETPVITRKKVLLPAKSFASDMTIWPKKG